MHIGLARRGYSPTGGAESYLRRLVAALAAKGHAPTLFASPEWPRDQRPAEAGFETVRGRGPASFATGLERSEARRRCDLLFSLERVWRCDCYRAGDGVHRAWLERRTGFEPGWRGVLRRWNPKHCQLLALEESLFGQGGAGFVIANSHLIRDEITAHYPAYPPERIAVVYNGLPPGRFQPAAPEQRARARQAFGLEPDDFILLFAGTGWERKGFACALTAVARLPDSARARLLVAGRGNPRPYRRQAGRARFLGPVRDMASIYAAADLFVLPTLYDPFSNACLEALAAGLPVLTTRANGFAEVLAAGVDGDVFDAGDDAALASLALGWSDPARRQAARPLCARKAAAFSIERNVNTTLAILARLAQ
ncbi:MAG: glycosyltransferase family 4 protein [Gluconacetobacter diazotrophicus]|nr:glycosyltransferase family 4 protein [Gluconacetobacter diazotrophicus]